MKSLSDVIAEKIFACRRRGATPHHITLSPAQALELGLTDRLIESYDHGDLRFMDVRVLVYEGATGRFHPLAEPDEPLRNEA